MSELKTRIAKTTKSISIPKELDKVIRQLADQHGTYYSDIIRVLCEIGIEQGGIK